MDMSYNQFTGTLQVMKAVKNHLVLTFCQTLPKGQLFSIVLSRRPNTLTTEVSFIVLDIIVKLFAYHNHHQHHPYDSFHLS